MTINCTHQSPTQGFNPKGSMTQKRHSGLRVHLDFDARVLLRKSRHVALLVITICGIALVRCGKPPLLIHIHRPQPFLHDELATATRGQVSKDLSEILRHPLDQGTTAFTVM